VADGADGVVKRLAVFAHAGFDVAGRAITLKNGLPVGFGHFQGMRAVGFGLDWNHRRQNVDFEDELFEALVGLDIDRLDLHSGSSSQVDCEAKLRVRAGGNDPRQRRQLCRGAAAGRMNLQNGDGNRLGNIVRRDAGGRGKVGDEGNFFEPEKMRLVVAVILVRVVTLVSKTVS